MALTISGLNRQLRELKRRQQEEQDAHVVSIRRLEQQFDEQLARLTRERDELLRRTDRDAREEYQQTLLRLLDEIERITNARLQQLEEEYRQHEARSKTLNEQIRAENEQIKAQLRQNIKESEALDERAQALASDCIDEAEDACQSVEQRPVRRFFGGRLDEYALLLRQARDNFRSGLYQAAAAMASNARAAVEGISADLDLHIEEWQRHFNVWKALVASAQVTLENCVRKPIDIDGDEVELSAVEWNFWSRGEYSALAQDIAERQAEIAAIEEIGIEAYMNGENALSTDELRARVEAARDFACRITALIECSAECVYSDRRVTAAERITLALESVGYFAVEQATAGFAPPDPMTAQTAWYRAFWDERVSEPIADYLGETVSPLGYYQLAFTYRGGDRLRIRIIPKRVDDKIVGNVCLLEPVSKDPPDSTTVRLFLQANAERIRTVVGDIAVQCVGSPMELEAQTTSMGNIKTKRTRLTV